MNKTTRQAAARRLPLTHRWYVCTRKPQPPIRPRPRWYRQIPRWVWALTVPAAFSFGTGLTVIILDLVGAARG